MAAHYKTSGGYGRALVPWFMKKKKNIVNILLLKFESLAFCLLLTLLSIILVETVLLLFMSCEGYDVTSDVSVTSSRYIIKLMTSSDAGASDARFREIWLRTDTVLVVSVSVATRLLKCMNI